MDEYPVWQGLKKRVQKGVQKGGYIFDMLFVIFGHFWHFLTHFDPFDPFFDTLKSEVSKKPLENSREGLKMGHFGVVFGTVPFCDTLKSEVSKKPLENSREGLKMGQKSEKKVQKVVKIGDFWSSFFSECQKYHFLCVRIA